MGTVLAWITLLAVVMLGVYTWSMRRELDMMRSRLDRYNRALFSTDDEVERLREQSATSFSALRAEMAYASGRASIRPDMALRDIYAVHPQAQELLATYHVGGCSSCAVELDDTLERVCRQSNLDPEKIVQNLNGLLGPQAATGLQHRQRVKLPNLQLEG